MTGITKHKWPAKIRAAIFMLASAAILMPGLPAHALDPGDKKEVEEIIRTYLLQNPELMLEVQQALELKQQIEAKTKAKEALEKNAKTVFESPNQANIGNLDGDVTVVEFFDYNCGFCQRAMDDMNTLLKTDNNLKFVLKELPILSAGSVEASRISTAVYRLYPEKYADFHNALMSTAGQKDGKRALQIAANMSLDLDKLNAEGQKDDVVEAFREVNDLANSLGINGTPSYVIGDEVIFGALGEDILRQKIENVRKCGSTICS